MLMEFSAVSNVLSSSAQEEEFLYLASIYPNETKQDGEMDGGMGRKIEE